MSPSRQKRSTLSSVTSQYTVSTFPLNVSTSVSSFTQLSPMSQRVKKSVPSTQIPSLQRPFVAGCLPSAGQVQVCSV